jgi:DNA-binding response OmpR family regulator
MSSILLVEDDKILAGLTAEFLRAEGFTVDVVHRGDEAVAAVHRLQPKLIILDVMLPGLDGFTICKQIRSSFTGLVMMMTALEENAEQLTGFDVGADDYVVKPIDPQLLAARVRAMLRRQPRSARISLANGQFILDTQAQQAFLNGSILPLSTAESELLTIFCRHAGAVLGRDALLQNLRRLDYDGLNRSIDMRVSRLRKKLQNMGCPVAIQTVTAQGYILLETNDGPNAQ